MRHLAVLMVLVGCGPTVTVDGDDGAGSDGMAATGDTTDGGADGATSGAPGGGTTMGAAADDSAETSTGNEAPSSTGAGDSESTGAPFSESDVHGGWLCTSTVDPFMMEIETYNDPHQLTGRVCAPGNKADDPLDWEPCGSLSSHPQGGGAQLWIFAVIPEADSLTVSAMLVYDPNSDSMQGVWQGPGDSPNGEPIDCGRLF